MPGGAAAAAAAATATSWLGSTASGDSFYSQENEQPAAKFTRYRSLRGRSTSTTASTGSRLMIGSSSHNSSSSVDEHDQHPHHYHNSVDNGQQAQQAQQPPQQQRYSATTGNRTSRSMSISRYRKWTNSISASGDATQSVQKLNADPLRPSAPSAATAACVDNNPPRGVAAATVPPVPPIPRLLRRRSSGSDGSSNSLIASRSSPRRRTEQKEADRHNHADATKVSFIDPPSPPLPPLPPPPPPSEETQPPPLRRRRLRHISDANLRGDDIAPLRRKMETTVDNYQQNQSRPNTAAGDERSLQQRRKMIDLDERRRNLTGEQDEAARWDAEETQRILAEQKKKDLERLQVQLASSHQATLQSHLKPKSPIAEKFAFLSKVRKQHKSELSPGLSPTTSSASASVSESSNRTATAHSSKTIPTGIEVGGRGIVPQTDAPASAINSGDRTVAVRCRHHAFCLDVTPETTAVDIIAQTSKLITYDLEINPSTCVVVESYAKLGLERRLRRYEHIRDVMNSWDQDSQNCLIVAVSGPEDDDRDLDVASVPNSEQPPPGFQLYMYHSNRPGKWNKRWITLLENGQIICAKKPNTQPSDKDATSLCRLSDYDIYSPTEAQMRKHLKPPKKYCFAVKSQQRTTVFVNTENFVQLFCTEDPDVAAQFQDRVHEWRSWYLVGRRPEARKKKPALVPATAAAAEEERISIPKVEERAPQITLTTKHTPKKSANVASMNGHRLKVSVDESPYAIGEFEPLLDMKRFDKRLSQFGKDFLPPAVPDASTMPKDIAAHIKHHQANTTNTRDGSHSHSNGSKADPQQKLIDTIKSTDGNSAGFTGGGLLGEGYEERMRHSQTQSQAAENNGENLRHNHNSINGTNGNHSNERSRSSTATNATSILVIEGPFINDTDTLLNKPPPPPREPNSPADKPESPSWFPSALEHSAKQRNVEKQQPPRRQPQQPQRPSTSAGVVSSSSSRRPSLPFQHGLGHRHERPPTSSGGLGGSSSSGPNGGGSLTHPNPLRSSPFVGGSSGAMSHSNRRERPKPLVNLDGGSNGLEVPAQWREKSGHGVAVPEGMNHIIDLISVAPNLLMPPASAPPRQQHHHHHHQNLRSHHHPSTSSSRRHHRHSSSSGSSNGGGGAGESRYLVDKISPQPPPRSALRSANGSNGTPIARSNGGSGNGSGGGGPHSAPLPLPLSRTRSKTAGAPPPISLRSRVEKGSEIPPMPPLPQFAGQGQGQSPGAAARPPRPPPRDRARGGDRDRDRGDRDRRDRDGNREKEKEKEKERKERAAAAFNSVPGRTGTLKVV